MTTDPLGRFDFYAADGRYDIVISGTGLTTLTQSNVEIFDATEKQTGDTSASMTFNSLNNFKFVDGTKYALTAAGIQQAINDAPSGGTVVIPAGASITLSGVGSELILINKALRLIGAGWGGTITVDAAVGASTDIFHFKGTAAIEGVEIANLQILPASGTPGRHGINVDTTSFAISKVWIHNNYIGSFGGKSIASTNPTPISDGFFTSWIEHNSLRGGIQLNNAGDTIVIQENVIAGPGIGIDATFVVGAMNFTVEKNNITSLGAGFHLGSAGRYLRLLYNEFEGQVGVTGSNSAYVDIDGTAAQPCLQPVIVGNNIAGVQSGVDGLRLNWVEAASVHDNVIFRAGSAVNIRITANATAGSNIIGFNYYSPTSDTQSNIISDAASSAIFWNNPYSQVTQGGVGGGVQVTRAWAVPALWLNGGGIQQAGSPGAFNVPSIGSSDTIVGNATTATMSNKTFSDTVPLKRLKASQGTALVAGDFALSGGWGNTAAVSSVIGTDQGWTITITANGTGIAANPTITLTFKDGTWTSSPITVTKMTGGTGTITQLTEAPTATTNVITFNGTPVAASTYIISSVAIGR